MTRSITKTLCLLFLILTTVFAVAQTEFSADIVDNNNQKSGKGPNKVYFGKDKIRFDSADNSDPRNSGSVIFDLAKQSWVVIMTKQHMYMEMPTKMMENRGMFEFFRSGDVENACSDWLKLARNNGGTCHKVGTETVNGRDTVKYEGTNSDGDSSTVWLDSKLRFPVKWKGKNDGGEMQNIKEGSQPASLFDIPADYKKFDMSNMGSMMQQHQ
jgi:hypothetical protein